MAGDAALIDWSAPWLAPYALAGRAVCAGLVRGRSLPDALNQAAPAPVRFVPQASLPAGRAFEAHVAHSGECPTREGLHDLFHGLVWHRFPRAKATLNALHVRHLADAGAGAGRGPVRDAITLFDENGAFWDPPADLREALAARQWHRLFVELRPRWQRCPPVLFGHGLLTQLVSPRKPATARVLLIYDAIEKGADDDVRLAAALARAPLADKPFLPLPVLGVPGWWPANEEPAFYADPAVFRSSQ